MRPAVSIVIPAYNEEGNIVTVVREAAAALQRRGISEAEILLIDDGSRDGTGAAMRAVQDQLHGVRVIQHPVNRGLGAAIRTGLEASAGEAVFWVPGDGQYAVDEVLAALPLLSDAEVVVGLRSARGDVARGVISRCFHALILLLFRFDASRMSGIFVIRRSTLAQLQPRSADVFLNYEIPLLCIGSGYRLAQVDVSVRPRASGVSKVVNTRTIGRILWDMLCFRIMRAGR
jgi:glycosyltransferase involved in cell wall biosynthesis